MAPTWRTYVKPIAQHFLHSVFNPLDIPPAMRFLMQDELGLAASAALGHAVDMSKDGTQFIAGAPGGSTGYVALYEFDGSAWVSMIKVEGEADEAFGSSVVILSQSNDLFAVGAPGYLNGQGRVVVYEKNADGSFVQIGPAIVGEAGERLGETNTIAGESFSPTVIVGTANGLVKRFDFDVVLSLWVQEGDTADTGFGGDFASIAAASQSQEFVAGGNLDAAIYKLP